MSPTLVLAIVLMLLSSSFGALTPIRSHQRQHTYLTEAVRLTPEASRVGLDKCKDCIQFAEQFIDALLQFILQVGVVDSCGDLCQAFATWTGSQIAGDICQILCDIVGIKEFVNIIEKEDIDPIYYCELIPVCGINDHGDAKFSSFDIVPAKGPRGTTFSMSFQYVSKNGTGTGEINIDIDTVDGIPVGDSFLHELAPAGTYDGSIQLKAKRDPNCDPSQGPCETWVPGNYNVTLRLCNGECGSKHPHSQIYDTTTGSFEITKDNDSV